MVAAPANPCSREASRLGDELELCQRKIQGVRNFRDGIELSNQRRAYGNPGRLYS